MYQDKGYSIWKGSGGIPDAPKKNAGGGLGIVPKSLRGGLQKSTISLRGGITAGYPEKSEKIAAGWSEKPTSDTPHYLFKWNSPNIDFIKCLISKACTKF